MIGLVKLTFCDLCVVDSSQCIKQYIHICLCDCDSRLTDNGTYFRPLWSIGLTSQGYTFHTSTTYLECIHFHLTFSVRFLTLCVFMFSDIGFQVACVPARYSSATKGHQMYTSILVVAKCLIGILTIAWQLLARNWPYTQFGL